MILRFRFILLVFLTCYWTKSENELSIDDIGILTKQYSEHVTDVITQMSKAVAHTVIEEATILSQISRDVGRQLTSLSKLCVDHVVDITSQMTQAVGNAVVKAAMDLGEMFGDIARQLTSLSKLYVDHVVDITSQMTQAVGNAVVKAAMDLCEMFGDIARQLTSLSKLYFDHVVDITSQMTQDVGNAVVKAAMDLGEMFGDIARQLTSLSKLYFDHVLDITSQMTQDVGNDVVKAATDFGEMLGDIARQLTSLSKLYVDHVVDITSQMAKAVGNAVLKAAVNLGEMFGEIDRELISLPRLYADHVVDITSQMTKAVGHAVIKAATDLSEMFEDIARELINLYTVYMDKATVVSTRFGQSAENVIDGLISNVIFYANQMATVISLISCQVTKNITDLSRLCFENMVINTYQLGQRVETALCWLTDHVTQIDAECVASVFGSVVICLVLELLTFILITAAIEGALCVFSLPLLLSVIYHQRQRKPKKEKGLASGVLVPWQSPVITLLPSIRVKVILPPVTITVVVPLSILVAMIRQKDVAKSQQSSRLLALTYKASDPEVDVPTESPMVLEKTPDYTVYKQVPSRCRRGVLNIARKGPVTVRRPKNFVR